MIKNMENFLQESNEMLKGMVENLENLKTINLNNLQKEKTLLVIIDMNKGFAKKGNLYSPRVEGIIPNIEKLATNCLNKDILTIAYSDKHDINSPELKSYLEHCLSNTAEHELVDELSKFNIPIFYKNSTNGFIANKGLFGDLLTNYSKEKIEEIDTFVVVGCVTDICIYQFSITLKAYLNEKNKNARVIIPIDCIETFDIPNIHNAEFMNVVFLNSMISNGIEVVKGIG